MGARLKILRPLGPDPRRPGWDRFTDGRAVVRIEMAPLGGPNWAVVWDEGRAAWQVARFGRIVLAWRCDHPDASALAS